MESAFILGGSAGASSADGLDWANLSAGNALDAWDFLTDQARFNSVAVGPLANTPGWSFTRASTGYAQTSAGALTAFASGELRRTDKGVLIEGARTNLCLQSQTFDNASWTKTNITVTADAGVAPDGTSTADLCTVTATGSATIVQATSAVSGTNCCASIYVQNVSRSDTSSSFLLRDLTAATIKVNCSVNWSAMTVSGTGASIERLGSTNWYRIAMVDTAWTTTNVAQIYAGAIGNSMTGGQAWYPWGAQLEAAAFPSSYIPTTTASATRAADVLTVPVTQASPLTGFLEFAYADGVTSASAAASQYGLVLGSADSSNRLIIYNPSSANGQIVQVAAATQSQIGVVGTVLSGVTQKVASTAATNDFRFVSNGTLATPDTSGTALSDIVTARFGSTAGSNALFGYIRRVAIWPRALSDSELQTVST